MRGNSFGNIFTITTFGESHGVALGVVIDGMPAGIELNEANLQAELERRRPGRLKVSTNRNEKDQFEVLSGIFGGKTLGTPISIIVRNTNHKSEDYNELKTQIRPGHADQTTIDKFGIRDHRGGGRASGRETLARVIAGYFAKLIIPQIKFQARITQIANIDTSSRLIDEASKLGLQNSKKDLEVETFLLELKSRGESAGGCIELRISNCPAGLGEPVFDKLRSDLAKALTSIGSCIGVTFGSGIEFAHLLGSEISKDRAHFGGMEGGISNGDDIICQLYFKAPSTVGQKALEGRHDPCILPRVIPVVESMASITIADHSLRQNAFKR